MPRITPLRAAVAAAAVTALVAAAVAPASRMWYPEIEIVLKLGSRSAQ